MPAEQAEQATIERKSSENPFVEKFSAFFAAQYKKEIERLVESYPEKRSLEVNFALLQQFDYQLADELIESPDFLLEAAEQALERIDIPALEVREFKPHVRFNNLPKDREKLIRDIGSADLGKMISVEGVVRQITDVLPRLLVAAWKCRRCGNVYRIEQQSQEIKMPAFCECRHRDFELVTEQSTFIDSQKIQIQEPLERLRGSEQAVYLDTHAIDDLVNKISVGDKTRFVGVLRLRPGKEGKVVYGRFLSVIHLEETEKEFEEVEINPEEEKEIQKLARNPKIYEMLAASVAPAIYGHEVVKESIILQLFGGVKKYLPGEQTIRGNIHVLLVGDPSCLVADERIVLGNGAIEKIGGIGSKHLQQINMQVLTGEGGKKRDTATVFHYFKNQPIIEIITETGKSIKGTPNHPLQFVGKENGAIARFWKRLDEFRIGDKVAVVTSIPCTISAPVETGFKPLQKRLGPKFNAKLPQKVTTELGAFLGYLLGDGLVRKYETGFVVSEKEKDILQPLLNLSEKLFAKKPSVARRKSSSFGKKIPGMKRKPGKGTWLNYASIYSEDIAFNLSFLREKRVPNLIFKSGNKVVASFLRWLYQADGCVFSKGRGRRSVSFKAKDVELLRDIQMLLLRFSIHSRINENNLVIRRGKDIAKFAAEIGFASKNKQQTLAKLSKEAKRFARFNSQRSERIVKIVKHEPAEVFDIEVPNSHRFIANGVISHNTGKSQMLQAAHNIAPKSIYTAGKTTSLHPEEPIVLRESGNISIKNIGDFVDGFFCSEEKEIIPVGKKVEALCMNPKTLKIEWKPISFVIRHRTNEELYKLTFETGREITVTGAHSIFTLEDGEICLKEASKLEKGDCAFCPSKIPNRNETPVDKKMAKFLGYYLAEGHTNENKESYVRRIGFTLNARETDIVEDITAASIEHFGKQPCVYNKGENGLSVTIYGKEPYGKMKSLLGGVFGLHAINKRIPEIIFNATGEERKAFIDAYLAGDAGVTKSKYLMSDLHYLFLENSIIASHYTQAETPAPKIREREILSKGDTYRLNSPNQNKRFSQRYCRPPISKMPKLFREKFLQKAVSDKYSRVHMKKLNNKQLLERLLLVSHREQVFSEEIKKTCGKNSLQYFRKRKTLFNLKRTGRNCCTTLTETGKKMVEEYLKVKKLLESDLGFIIIKEIKKVKFDKEFVYDVSVPGNESFVAGFGGIICHNSGVGLCVAPDSLVLNDNGFKRIEDFVEENFCDEKAVEEIPGAWTNDFFGKNQSLNQELKLEDQKVDKIWRIKAPAEMIEIETRLGKQLQLTPNTSVIRIKDNKIEWIKAKDAMLGDFIACSRKLPAGEKRNIPTIGIIASNKNIEVKDNIAVLLKEITNKLVEKYGTLQEIAKKIGKSRDTLYAIRNKKFYHAISLHNFVELGKEAGLDLQQLSEYVSEIFLSHGKTMLLPRYLDDEKIAYLAGLALGDGCLNENGNTSNIRIFSASEQLLAEVDKIAWEKFGLKAEKIDDGIRVPGRRIKFKAVCDILKAFGLHKDKTKIKISHLASEMPNNVLAKLLQGLFDTDGWVCAGKDSHCIGMSTISKDLAQSVQLSLLKFGIRSKLRERKKAGAVAIGKKISVKSNYNQFCVEITSKENIGLFREHIGFNLKRKKEELKKLAASVSKGKTNLDFVPEIHGLLKAEKAAWIYSSGRSNISREKLQRLAKNQAISNPLLKQLAESDIIWEQIVEKQSFKPDYEFVYDFSVEKNHNFIANGIFVHNTASAVKDDFGEGGWTLKAGALVLSSGGVCMADELDKMDPEDRYALHEAMEQGMISVAKAGIVTRFKAESSILAAANPKFSRFDQYTPFIEQINLPATLISRFDLFFMMKDVLDKTRDEAISAHILQIHKSGEIISQYKKKGKTLSKKEQQEIDEIAAPAIGPDLLSKYISYTRQNIFPALSKEAIATISDFYVNLRDLGRKEGSYTATHRQLEGLVRLSEASARVRLSDNVEKEDAERAIRLVKASLSDVVTDPETGKIDYDIIATGVTHTQITNMKKILGIVQGKAREMDAVPVQDVLAEAEAEGISKDKARDLIAKLEKKGELYRPRHDLLKPTQKE